MPSRSPFSTASFALVALLFTPGCGSDTAGGGGGDAGDGKVHPTGNGQHQSESDACKALSEAHTEKSETLACTSTSRPCPSLIQVMVGGTACREYDQGSVQGCADHYAKQTSCDALAKAVDDCVVISFEGSEPAGCP